MLKIVSIGTSLVIGVYIIAASFGYLTWAGSRNIKTLEQKKNILSMDYEGNVAFTIATVSLSFAVFAAAPICVLPLKDSFEALYYKDQKMTNKQNLVVTISTVVVCYVPAILIPQIGDAITLVGFTINPLVGFIFPCLYYLKLNENLSQMKVVAAWNTIFFISLISIYGLADFFYGKFSS